METLEATRTLNINCGVLGHVDSGKTSLVKALSKTLSTCALDKHPQSQQRGITLDLGFSAFTLAMPEHLKSLVPDPEASLQFTLVDCPGHASLIRTIIGGAQIIDMILLVVDANKGIQTQTAECIVIGEITTDNLIIVLNKIDALPLEDRDARLEKVTARIRKTFAATKFKDAPIVQTAASVGGEKVAAVVEGGIVGAQQSCGGGSGVGALEKNETIGIDTLVELIRSTAQLPRRNTNLPFYFAVDHCFPIKGHGTVLTGTVLSGSVSVNSTIELPELQQTRKVKSMQMFRRPVKVAHQGDRVGICVTSLDSALVERGIATAPGSVPLISTALCLVKKVRFFKGSCRSNHKYHVSIGHTTIVADVMFFGASELGKQGIGGAASWSAGGGDNILDDGFGGEGGGADDGGKTLNAKYRRMFPSLKFDFTDCFQQQDELLGCSLDDGAMVYGREPVQWALLRFQQAVYCPLGSLIIGSRLDTTTREGAQVANQCRLAFYGPVVHSLSDSETDNVQIFNWKQKTCEVFKQTDWKDGLCFELIARGLFGEGGTVKPFLGMALESEDGHLGTITGAFGAGGKFKVKFAAGAPRSRVSPGSPLILRFRRFVNDKAKLMRQEQHDGAGTGAEAGPAASNGDSQSAFASTLTLDDDGDKAKDRDAAVDKGKELVRTEPTAPTNDRKKSAGSLTLVAPRPAPAPAAPPPPPPLPPRVGAIESLKEPQDGNAEAFTMAIVTGAFRMEEDIKKYAGAEVAGPQGQRGELKGPFAKLGKCKVSFPQGLPAEAQGATVQIFLPQQPLS